MSAKPSAESLAAADAALRFAEDVMREAPDAVDDGRYVTVLNFVKAIKNKYPDADLLDLADYANEQLCHPRLSKSEVAFQVALATGTVLPPDLARQEIERQRALHDAQVEREKPIMERMPELLATAEREAKAMREKPVMERLPELFAKAEQEAAARREQGDATKARPALLKLTEIALTGGKGNLVADLLNQGEISAIIGAPGSGKSYAAGLLAYCVAAKQDWLGRFTAHGPAVYVAAERGIEQAKRLRAWCAADNVDPDTLPLRIINGTVNMLNTKTVEGLAEEINAFAKAAGEPVKLIVIDTIPATMPGHDLNDSGKATQYAEHVKRLAKATGAAVMCVHHTPKDGRSTGLGSVQFDALFDGILRIESGAQGKHGTLRLAKCNTIASPEWEIRWASETVEADIDGAPVVVNRFTATTQRDGREAPRGQAGVALTVLADLTLSGQGVTLDAWREACRDKLSKPGATRQARDAAFSRAADKLADHVAVDDGRYRPAGD